MLINDLISVMAPHHTADDKCGDGRLGGTTCGFPPCLVLSEGGKSIKAEQRLLSRPRRGAVIEAGGSG